MTLLDLMTVWDAESGWREMEQLGLSILLAFAAQSNLDVSTLTFVDILNLILENINIYWIFCHYLTHWGRVTHICVGKLIIIGSDNGFSLGRCQAIIWTNAGIWSMGPLGTNCNEILIEIHTFSFTKMHLKMLSAKWRLFCLGLNVLTLARHVFEIIPHGRPVNHG